jgi:hypothetical protein
MGAQGRAAEGDMMRIVKGICILIALCYFAIAALAIVGWIP